MELSSEQQEAIKMVMKKNISIITGPPGSGKTTLIKSLMKELKKKYPNCLLTAPTGAACDRLLQATDITAHVIAKIDFSEKLIHEYQGACVVIDEATMLSTTDLYRMLIYLRPKKVCLVGDCKQLPCQDGLPSMTSLMQTEVIPIVRLTSNFRRKNDQVSKLAKCVASLGEDGFVLDHGDDSFRVIECQNTEQVIEEAAKAFFDKPSQMITFTRKMNNDLNKATETKADIVIPASSGDGVAIREGDRVVCTNNLYGKNKKLLVANGVVGTCTSKEICYANGFVDTKRRGKFRSYCVPCRCITTHKAQGSEFTEQGIVVLTYWKGPIPLELTYTALTRFKKNVIVIGLSRQIQEAFYGKFTNKYDTELVAAIKAIYKQKRNELAWRFSADKDSDDDTGDVD